MAPIKETTDGSALKPTEADEYQNGAAASKKTSKPPKASSKPSGGDGSLISTLLTLRRASRRPLPTETGDGTYRQVIKRPGLRQDLRSLSLADLKTLVGIISAKLKGETQSDDKTMLMERTIQLVAGLPNKSRTQETLTNSFIDQLWNSLDHPAMLYMGDEFKYRRPDGAYNNPIIPQLGAAGTPYSRTVKPRVTALGAQPDPETIFESVMARDGFRRNPNNVSSILWYWATIVIHDLFSTNLRDPNINDASSYLDLAPLYGSTQEAQNGIRTFKDGMLKPDSFADKRLLGNPPGVVILLIMFNRFHNHVAESLATINEHNRFPKPAGSLTDDAATAAWKKYDEELFQTARLVTSGLYINITLIDYVRNIINLNRVDSQWTLDPRQEMGVSAGTSEGSEAGVGNAVSAEFNLCYRWHSCISEMDDKWIQDFYTQILGENYGEMSLPALGMAFKKFEASIPDDPGQRTFSGFERGPDGKFNDDELADALATAIEQPGGAFGGRNVPRIMKPVEMLGILRGRKWNLAGLNEFRKHFGLKAHETFEDINSDPQVADSLRHLYNHPDNVELYPGLVAEEAKQPMVPGVGIAPTYTISRVVLSDAVALVRGDRYYTTDYHPGYLTNWGYNEANYDFSVNHGCVFYKLFLRSFPNHFKSDSVYAHYPMVIPPENHKILTNLKRVDLFNFDRPTSKLPRVNITSYGGAKHVLNNQDKYSVPWQSSLGYLSGDGDRFASSGKTPFHAEQQRVFGSFIEADAWKIAVKSFYSSIAKRLLAEKSYKLAGATQVDLVRDVGNLAHTHFVARLFNLPLKSTDNPKGVISEQELYSALAGLYVFLFLDIDPVKSFPLKQTTRGGTEQLSKMVKLSLTGLRGLFISKSKDDTVSTFGVKLAKDLSKAGLSSHDIAWTQILPVAAAYVPNQALLFVQAADWYLSPAGVPYRAELGRIASQEAGPETDALLLGYALEGIRLAGASKIYRSAVAADTIIEDDGRTITVNAGDQVCTSFTTAAEDATHFPNPDTVNPRRPIDAYANYGVGPFEALGKDVTHIALVELFRVLFSKKGLKRAPGLQGMLKKVPREGGFYDYLTEDWGTTTPFPTTFKVTWEDQ